LGDFKEVTTVPAVAGTMLMIRNELFRLHRGFDSRFFMYMEDTDLCYRMHRAGCRNLFVPQAGAVHKWGKGSKTGRFKRNWMHHVSVWKYFKKHSFGIFTILVLPFLLGGNLLLVTIFPFLQRQER
jgi:hypothetical protein